MSTATLPAAEAATIDQALTELVSGARAWKACGLAQRRDLIQKIHAATAANAEAWVTAASTYKQLPDGSQLRGEEWTSGPYAVLTATAVLAQSIAALEAGRSPVDGYRFGKAPGGRTTVKILPHGVYDRLLLSGFTAEVWMPPGVTEATVREQAGLALRDPAGPGGVGVVLGAGNITSIPVLDVLYELYANNRVALLKLNPVTDVLFDVFSKVLAPLIEPGLVRIVRGGADVGTYLVRHDLVDHVHMTGSALTHDAIVWGTGAEGAARKAAGTPLLTKPITSELGGVSPTIVVPGRWSDADLRFQAEHVATQKLHNGGYNCIASQIVVVGSDWPQKDAFLKYLRDALAKAPARPAYYPGSDHRVAQACEAYPDAERIRSRVLISVPGDPGDTASEPALTTEYFGPVLGVMELPGDARTFLATAVRTANDRLTGTLGANVIADPRTISALGAAFDQAIADLRYGTVTINAWTGVGYLTAAATWGAFPGHTLDDVQSGIGVVHNAVLLASPERTVLRGPFRPAPRALLHGEPSLSPKPPWFVSNKTAATTGRRLVGFAARPRWSALPGVFISALRG
ncbi:aldehyde dehydrogenase family protein [Catenulispora subtropica]|uniref:Aldehyde dehydrogenase family protein n=1 Tax=Catenulispora subtropica TaxID=450798 RepID=A0ABN2S6T3_9ACTN